MTDREDSAPRPPRRDASQPQRRGGARDDSRIPRRDSEMERGPEAPGRTPGLAGLVRSFGFAFSGIGQAFATQRNMRIHAVVAVCALVACAVLRCTPAEWAIVIVLIGAVFAAELINTAIESAVDLETRGRRHPLAKRAKDTAAGAVLVLAITAVVAGLVVYITAFIRLLAA